MNIIKTKKLNASKWNPKGEFDERKTKQDKTGRRGEARQGEARRSEARAKTKETNRRKRQNIQKGGKMTQRIKRKNADGGRTRMLVIIVIMEDKIANCYARKWQK